MFEFRQKVCEHYVSIQTNLVKSEEEYQDKYASYEIERKEMNRLRRENQDKVCNIVFSLCVIVVGLLIIVYAYVYLVLIHKIKWD